jgi:uncharacterized membrane protein YphA (DoxX/SURF4 family)
MVGAILVLAALSKMATKKSLSPILLSLGIPITPAITHLADRIIPIAEIVIGALLALGLGLAIAAPAALLMMLIFTAVVIQLRRREYEGDCACFGNVLSTRVSWIGVVRNIVLSGAALVIVVSGFAGCRTRVLWQMPGHLVLSTASVLLVLTTAVVLGAQLRRVLQSNNSESLYSRRSLP